MSAGLSQRVVRLKTNNQLVKNKKKTQQKTKQKKNYYNKHQMPYKIATKKNKKTGSKVDWYIAEYNETGPDVIIVFMLKSPEHETLNARK